MRNLFAVMLLVLVSAGLLIAQNNGQEGQSSARPTNDPRTNSEITGTVGSTTGHPASPAYAGDQKRNIPANQTGVGDTQAAQRGRQPRAKGTGSDDGTIRDSNVVAKMHGKSQPTQGKKQGTIPPKKEAVAAPQKH
jgi:hypothetical protein